MDDKSTPPGDNPTNVDGNADATTNTDPQPGTDNQPAPKGDNTDPPSKSDDTTVTDDDKKSDSDSKTDDKSGDKSADKDAPASFDDDLDDWITKTNRPKPENDEQRQVLQDLRNSQRDFTRTQQSKKDTDELDKEISTAKDAVPKTDDDDDDRDETEKRLDKIDADRAQERTTRLQSEFYIDQKVTPEEHKIILDVMKEKFAAPSTPEAKKAAIDLWGSPEMLPDLLDIARARIVKATDNSAVVDEAAQAEREKIAKESNAKSPNRSATTTPVTDHSLGDERKNALLERYSTPKK